MMSISFDALPAVVADLQAQISELKKAPATRGEIVNGMGLCKILHITEPTLIRWRNAGKIPYMAIGGALRYDVDAVISALSSKK